jgi:two-component system response regulator AtoC
MSGWYLEISHANGAEEVRELPDGRWLVGRERECWLAPLDTAMSRLHVRLDVAGDEAWLEVLPTRNGTRLNGEDTEGRRRLAPGDEVLVGRTLLKLHQGAAGIATRRQQRTVEVAPGGAVRPVGRSPAMGRLLIQAERVARTGLPVLITGESGTGKELFAQFLHASSPRSTAPFVILNCPALPPTLIESELFGVEPGVATGVTAREGLLEKADGGTLLLDEVGDLPVDIQSKLLRFLQDRSIQRVGSRNARTLDVRILAATNCDLEDAMEKGRFRADFFYRLAGDRLHLPPLRDRGDDVLLIAEDFLEKRAGGGRLADESRAALLAHPFPGNVRELFSVLERAAHCALGETIRAADLGLSAATDPRTSAGANGVDARRLLADVVDGRADFWEAVYEPFKRHDLPRAAVQEFLALAWGSSGGSVKGLAATLRAADRYRKLVDFLRNNDLLPAGADGDA